MGFNSGFKGLIQHPWGPGSCWSVRWCIYFPQVVAGSFLLLQLYLGCTANQRVIGYSIWIFPPPPGSWSSRSSSIFSGVFLAKEVDGGRGRGSVDTTMVDVQALYRPC